MGEAKVLAAVCAGSLKYTSGTDFLAYGGDRWYEDGEKALGIVEAFLDEQLSDAEETVAVAQDALFALGIDKDKVKSGGKELQKAVPGDMMKLFFALVAALTYKNFVMKNRDYKRIVNVMNAGKPMVAIDVSDLDADAELLNTPEGTYDLKKGLAGCREHDPKDLITKITGCSPGDEGEELWRESLNLFFCGDEELIEYVQRIVGQAAIGRVHEEHMIIAYGSGANGKSTFWNCIARVLGNYSGKISAEALTMNCKRNVKPEMAELKGKRLIIASELEEGTRLNTGMVKQLCSTDPIQAEKKYKAPFSFEPSHTLVLYTNHLPKVSANDEGTWRRLVVIPFDAVITGSADIKNFSDYLYNEAGPAILKWIIEGAMKAIISDFHTEQPKVVQDAVNEYRQNNDWLGQFLEQYCEKGPDYTEKSGDLYLVYRRACQNNGEYIRSTSDFYGSLEKEGYMRRKTNEGKLILGLRLKTAPEFLE
jgi:P4 family phage/plasmid primase-like protien